MLAKINPKIKSDIKFEGELKIVKNNYYNKTVVLENGMVCKKEELILIKESGASMKIDPEKVNTNLMIGEFEIEIKALNSECESHIKSNTKLKKFNAELKKDLRIVEHARNARTLSNEKQTAEIATLKKEGRDSARKILELQKDNNTFSEGIEGALTESNNIKIEFKNFVTKYSNLKEERVGNLHTIEKGKEKILNLQGSINELSLSLVRFKIATVGLGVTLVSIIGGLCL